MKKKDTGLDAGAVTLLEIFRGEIQYISPLFQRKYVWKKKQIESLWSGIESIINEEDSERFLGALVLEIKNSGSAFRPNSAWIVDGQQRLTTLYIMLIALAKIAYKNNIPEMADDIVKTYIFNQTGKYKGTPKISPTISDFTQFNNLLSDIKIQTPVLEKNYGPEHGSIREAYALIYKKITEKCFISDKFDQKTFNTLATSILEKLAFVQIILGDQHNAHQVFDSLNSDGIKLENKDLIRNLVFQKMADDPEKAEALYNSKWQPIEQMLGDSFDGYFFPFTLVEKPKTTKSNLLSVLREKWKDLESFEIIEDLNTHINTYRALVDYSNFDYKTFTKSQKINDQIKLMAKMNVPTSIYSFIFRMVRAYNLESIDDDTLTNNLRLIESFLIRRSIAGYEPTGLHALFKDMWVETKGDTSKILEYINSKPTIQFPNDQEFSHDIKNKPLYGRKLAQYIILQYERSFKKGDTTSIDAEFEIDHILPQKITPDWKLNFSESEHSQMLNLWANLVPLSRSANAQKGFKNWAETKDLLGKESIFKSTRYVAEKYSDWNKESIQNRSEEIAQWAINYWPRNFDKDTNKFI